MKNNKWIAITLIVVAMLLASCSGLSELNSSSQPSSSGVQNGDTNVSLSVTPTVMAASTPVAEAATQAPIKLAAGSGDLLGLETTFEQIYNLVNPSVVYIEVEVPADPSASANSGPSKASGSGFVWDMQGHIVTNNHVVNGATAIIVTFVDGTTVPAKVIGQDPNADLAVISVTVPSTLLHPVTVGDSNQVKVGQIAIAIGNPFGLSGSMSEGIISALARSLPVEPSSQSSQGSSAGGTYNIPDILQTDAAINPGNSGGVLVDIQGHVIGVTAAIASNSNSNSGIGFVIPSAIVQKVVSSLITSGTYAHPWLGVSGTTLTPGLATDMNLATNQRGALIISVTPGGPAAKAGIQPSKPTTVNGGQGFTGGDIIIAVNGQPVRQFEEMGSYLFLNTKPGDVVTLTVLRNGKEQAIKVTLGTLPNP